MLPVVNHAKGETFFMGVWPGAMLDSNKPAQKRLLSITTRKSVFGGLWESVIVLCFVVRYFMSILVLQSS